MNKVASIRTRLAQRLGEQGLDSAVTGLSYLATAGLGFINGPILANALGATGRGELAAVVATTQLIGFMTAFGMPRAAVYFASELRWRQIIMSSWTTAAIFTLPLLALLFPAYQWILEGKQDLTISWFYAYLALSAFAGPTTTTVFWLRGMRRVTAFNLFSALPAVLTSIGYVVLFLLGELDLQSALASTFIAQLVAYSSTLIYGRSWPGTGFTRTEYRTQLNYGLRAWFGSFAYLVTFRVDQVILAGVVSSEDLGHYVVAATGATLSLPVSRAVSQTLLPHLRSATTDAERFAALDRALRWVRISSGAILVLLAVSASTLVPILFGEDFRASIVPLLILLPGQFVNDIATVHAAALDAFNRPEQASKAQILSAVITVAGLAVFAPTYGIRGAACVTTVAYFGYGIMVSGYSRQLRTASAQSPNNDAIDAS